MITSFDASGARLVVPLPAGRMLHHTAFRLSCQSSTVARVVDAEGAHLAAILRAAEFTERRVLEVGCGDGRLTWGIARLAASVLAFDPVPEDVAVAQASTPDELREKVRFAVASAEEIEVPRESVDLVFFSWSL